MDCGNAVIVMRTGLELLNFGYEPIEKVREDTVHYLGKCQALEKERMLIFGSVVIGIEQIKKSKMNMNIKIILSNLLWDRRRWQMRRRMR